MDGIRDSRAPGDLSGSPRKRRLERWKWRAILLAAVATGPAAFMAPSEDDVLEGPVRSAVALTLPERPADAPLALPPRRMMSKRGRDLFAARSVPAPASTPTPAQPEAPVAPSAPPNPYRFAGTALYDGGVKNFITLGDRIYEVKPGMVLDGDYRVQSVTPDSVSLVYLPLGIEQRLVHGPRHPRIPVSPQTTR
ncbi:MAG TPA: hypothetical protein VFZ81_13390 [Burkholderiales bacterium]